MNKDRLFTVEWEKEKLKDQFATKITGKLIFESDIIINDYERGLVDFDIEEMAKNNIFKSLVHRVKFAAGIDDELLQMLYQMAESDNKAYRFELLEMIKDKLTNAELKKED